VSARAARTRGEPDAHLQRCSGRVQPGQPEGGGYEARTRSEPGAVKGCNPGELKEVGAMLALGGAVLNGPKG